MKKALINIILLFGLGLLSCQVLAANLMAVYQNALDNDPIFKMSRSTWLSERENIAINRAGLLPKFDIDANYGRNYNDEVSLEAIIVGEKRYYSNSGGYTLDLKQPIFNYKNWASLKEAKVNEKQYAAKYSAATQDLMYRTTGAYFNVLKAEDVLRFTSAEKRSLKSQLERTGQRYKVGLATITDLQQTRSQYDTTVAQEIKDRNDVSIQKEKLREITNNYYPSLAKLTTKMPLLYPDPIDVNQWVKVAQDQNYTLLAARFGADTAQEDIRVQAAGHLPVLNAEGKYQYLHSNNYFGTGASINNHQGTIGVDLNLPVFEGGSVTAKTKQAKYNYQNATEDLEKTNRTVISDTRQSYLNVISGVNIIKANKQAVVSARTSLQSTITGYEVGTQTMTDVLIQESNLYESLKSYAVAKYDYIVSTIALKYATGVLSVDDLRDINSWLKEGYVPTSVPIINPVSRHHRQPKPIKHQKATKHKAKPIYKINPKHYTAQIMAAKNHKAVINFMNRCKLPTKTMVFRTCKHGQYWYVLIMGEYSTSTAAKSAVQRLPANIRRMNPWIRNYASVRRSIC